MTNNVEIPPAAVPKPVVLCVDDEGPILTAAALSGIRYMPAALATTATWELPEETFDLEQHEIDIVRRALHKHGGNKTQTARYLGLSLKASRSRLQKL